MLVGSIAGDVLEGSKYAFNYWWVNFKNTMGMVSDQISAGSISMIQSAITSCGLDTSGVWAVDFFNKLNFFFPVNETFVILNILFVFWLGVFCLKVFLKLIPTVY